MTWKEFKKEVERLGIRDEHKISVIDITINNHWSENPEIEVEIYHDNSVDIFTN